MLRRFALFPEQASSIAGRVDALFFFLVGLTAVFTLLIAGLIVVFMIRFRRRHDDERGADVHGSLGLEVLWTAIPLALAMVVFFWGASLYAALRRAPDDALAVTGIGKQWMWKFQHLEGRREINELHVPVGRSVRLTLTSEDVIHSFFVPAFRVKQDAVPGRYATVWFEATKPGRYHLFCAEYCGTLHAGMIGSVVAMDPADFQAWLAGRDAADAMPAAARGERLFQNHGCASCHRSDAAARAPDLVGLFGRIVRLRDGREVTVDEGYLRESILTPQAKVVEGYDAIMPTYQGLIAEEGLLDLIAWIKAQGAAGTETR